MGECRFWHARRGSKSSAILGEFEPALAQKVVATLETVVGPERLAPTSPLNMISLPATATGDLPTRDGAVGSNLPIPRSVWAKPAHKACPVLPPMSQESNLPPRETTCLLRSESQALPYESKTFAVQQDRSSLGATCRNLKRIAAAVLVGRRLQILKGRTVGSERRTR